MVKTIDISDLLVQDPRLSYNWRSAKVKDNQLTVAFPHPGYSIDVDKSELRDGGKEWVLYVSVAQSFLTALGTQTVEIPSGVEKVVLGTVDYL